MPPDASRAESVLELQHVSKFFGDQAALKDVNVSFRPGEAALLYGPNGAGKTTLLRTLATLVRPSEGTLLFEGADAHREPARARSCLGFVSHQTFLYGELTARENLKLAATLFGLADAERRIAEVLDLLAIRHRAGEPVRHLSRGLQQRVALARAFLHDPRFLLLDEPFTGLDAASAESLSAVLKGLPESGKALVFSTHAFEQGAAIARRLIALENGRVTFDGALADAPLAALKIQLAEGSRQ
jgi:ABC-type multidrug transport system ATPase subunit